MAEVAEKPTKKEEKLDINTVNGLVSERLRVKPLKEGEIAIYKLIKSDMDDITRTEESSGKKMKHQQVYSFPGRKRIYDPFLQKRILIQYVTSFRHVKLPSGEVKEEPIVSRVTFPRSGEIILTSRDFARMQFLERMEENRDNEFRDPAGPKPIFYRVNSKRQAIKELEDDYFKVDALVHIKNAEEVELKRIYHALDADEKKNINANEGYEQLKRQIFKLAEKNPKLVLKASSNKEAKKKVQILDAERFRIIVFDEGDEQTPRRWVFIDREPMVICEVEPGVHKFDGLYKFFESEKGKEWYVKVVNSLKEALNPKR